MTPPKRILILTPSIDGSDGVSAVARAMVRAFAHASLELWCLTADAHGERIGGVSYRFASGSRLRYIWWAVARAAAPQNGAFILVAHLHLAPVALALLARGSKLAVFLHGIEAWQRLSRLRLRALGKAGWLLAPSRHTAERFRAANPAVKQKVRVCAHGIAAEPPVGASRGETGFALIVGRMAASERYKGHDLLLDLWPRLLASFPEARLMIAGDGDDRARLEVKAGALGLSQCVRFLGRVSDSVLSGLYERCAFLALPSTNEGFGLVFLEAMRAGKPSIAAHGAADEIIEHEVSGLLVNPDNPEELLFALRVLFEDPRARERMGRAAAARFHREFTEIDFERRLLSALDLQEMSICAESPVS